MCQHSIGTINPKSSLLLQTTSRNQQYQAQYAEKRSEACEEERQTTSVRSQLLLHLHIVLIVPSNTNSPIIYILAGKQRFETHWSLLKRYSGTISRMLGANPPPRDRDRNFQIELPEVSARIFERFVEFLYLKRLEVLEGDEEDEMPDENDRTPFEDGPLTLFQVCKAWLAGEQLQALEFQNQCLRHWSIKRAQDYQWDPEEIRYVWQRSKNVGFSLLQKFLIDSYCHAPQIKMFENVKLGSLPQSFLYALISETANKNKTGTIDGSKKFWLKRDITPFLTNRKTEIDLTMDDDEEDIITGRAPSSSKDSFDDDVMSGRATPQSQARSNVSLDRDMPDRSVAGGHGTARPSWLASPANRNGSMFITESPTPRNRRSPSRVL